MELDLGHWWESFKIDLFGTMLCCRHAIPHLLATGRGAIINTTSGVALRPTLGRSAYGAAKGGVAVLTRELAFEFGSRGLRVNALAPGYTLTARVKRLNADLDMNSAVMKQHLLGPAEPEDIAAAAVFLASDEARRVTGVIVPVDSGFLL